MCATIDRVRWSSVAGWLTAVALVIAAPLPVHGTATLVSIQYAPGTGSGNKASAGPWGLSDTGRYVCFESAATNLIAGFVDGNGVDDDDVFVRDTQAGTTTLASVRHSGGASADLDSFCYGLSADGRFVAMVSAASDLVPGFVDGNLGGDDGFVRDLLTGTTELATVNAAGTASGNDGVGTIFELSADGRRVFFDSLASDLVPNDTNAVSDIFMRDLDLDVTRLVSVTAAGSGSGNGASTLPLSSANGRFVVFTSTASNLVAGFVDGNPATAGDLYIRDVDLRTTELVTPNALGTASANASSTALEITPDGRYVVFTSAATDLVAGDTNGRSDIFVRDVVANVTRLVSVAGGGASANDTSANGVPSADGRYVAFESVATNLIAGFVDGNSSGRDVFVRDLTTATTQLISVRRTGGGSANGASNLPLISADGGIVVFLSAASDLVSPFVDGNGAFSDIFVRDRVFPGTALVSRNTAADSGGANASLEPGGLSRDGRVLGFSSDASNLVDGDANGLTDVFITLLPVTPRPTWTPTPTGAGAVSGRIGFYANSATPVAAATVLMTGPTPFSVGSNATGQYAAAPLVGGPWSVRPAKAGGLGNSVSALDASYVLQTVVGLRVLSAAQTLAADVSGNGTVSALDAAMILQRVVGLRPQFPAAAACGSDWHFQPVPAPGYQSLVQPGVTDGVCQGGAIRFDSLAGTATGQDFLGIPIGDVTGNGPGE